MLDQITEISAAAIMGFVWSNILTQPGMIFGWFADAVESRLPYWSHKPLYSCVVCVTGFWFTIWLITGGVDWLLIPPKVFAAIFLTHIINRKFA